MKKNKSLRLLTEKEMQDLPEAHKDAGHPRVVEVGLCFKMERRYFRIAKITAEGVYVVGIMKKEYIASPWAYLATVLRKEAFQAGLLKIFLV